MPFLWEGFRNKRTWPYSLDHWTRTILKGFGPYPQNRVELWYASHVSMRSVLNSQCSSITSQEKLVKMKWDSTIRFMMLECKIRSTKFEIRNNFKIRIFQLFKQGLDFGHLEFGFVSSFDIRISDFDWLFGDAKSFARLCKEFPGHNTKKASRKS